MGQVLETANYISRLISQIEQGDLDAARSLATNVSKVLLKDKYARTSRLSDLATEVGVPLNVFFKPPVDTVQKLARIGIPAPTIVYEGETFSCEPTEPWQVQTSLEEFLGSRCFWIKGTEISFETVLKTVRDKLDAHLDDALPDEYILMQGVGIGGAQGYGRPIYALGKLTLELIDVVYGGWKMRYGELR